MLKTNIVKMISMLLMSCLLAVSLAASADAGTVQRRNPEAGKKKAAKRIGIGAAIGAGAGALIGGRKGALIGAGAGAGAGTAYHYHKKRSYRRHHRLY
ncbi:MAG: YMGG-like glycine zipper-containing protein [Blastocatellia bacterium]